MWLESVLEQAIANPICGYQPKQAPATEPTALAALFLASHGHHQEAEPALQYLLKCQLESGAVPIRQGDDSPGWPTSLAILAWLSARDPSKYSSAIASARKWLLEARGTTMERSPDLGHNSELVAWSWAENTHSWVEPTAFHVVALKALGQFGHSRVRDAVAMLIDRQLEGGGWNYGNTTVLGQTLRPHIQPTGTALLALEAEEDPSGRLAKSIAYLNNILSSETPATSLAYGLLGLSVHKQFPRDMSDWLEAAAARVSRHDRSPYKFILLALAEKGAGIGPFRKQKPPLP